jgi:hypothetical protein
MKLAVISAGWNGEAQRLVEWRREGMIIPDRRVSQDLTEAMLRIEPTGRIELHRIEAG